MSIRIVRHPDNLSSVPDDALIFYDAMTNEYYVVVMGSQILTWVQQ